MIIDESTGPTKYKYAALDTETHVYVDGVRLTSDQIRAMCGAMKTVQGIQVPMYPPQWWRQHAVVECWAYICYTPDCFFIAESWEEFWYHLVKYHIKTGWFYNAPFDFSILDYHLLTSGWKHTEKAQNLMEYDELCNDFGARYKMSVIFPYVKTAGKRSTRTKWKSTFYDLRNIFAGGLAKLLHDFGVTDEHGDDVRKLSMDYQAADGKTAEDIAYMRNDAAGLWWLIDKAGEMLSDLYGLDIRGGKPDVLTASGLAKRVFFAEMYPHRTWYAQKAEFKKRHPMDLDTDTYYRVHGLLQGGLVIINPDIKGKTLRGICAERDDVNSEYPYYMANMRSVYGYPDTYPTYEEARQWYADDDCYIYEIESICATVKPYAVPCWRNPLTYKIEADIMITRRDTSLLIFREELEELRHWYDITSMRISRVIVYKTQKEDAIERVIRREYARKTEARLKHDSALAAFSKIVMNGFGGKYSQNPRTEKVTRELGPYGVQKINYAEEIDSKSLMQIVQGARITAGGRIYLRKKCREICGDTGIRKHLFYTDTDSIHHDAPTPYTSPTELGALKKENKTPIVEACYLAPKTYYELEESGECEVHAKGIRTEDIERLHKSGMSYARIFRAGQRVQSLSALNVRGGKALLPFPKQIAKVTKANNIDERYD